MFAHADIDRYELGQELCEQVGPFQVLAGQVVAVVCDRQVRLTGADGRLTGECSCPAGLGGVFCEHCVAVAVLAVDVVRPLDAKALLTAVDSVSRTRPDATYPDRWADDAEKLLLTLEEATIGHPAVTRPLYQRLVRRLARNGSNLGSHEAHHLWSDAVEQATTGLVQACVREPADPDELAVWAFDLQAEEPAHFLDVADLVEALGPRGLATYRRRLDQAHRNLAPEDPYDHHSVHQHGVIAYIREQFLLAFEPDVEVLSAFYAENPRPGSAVSIAKALRSAGRVDEALAWLEDVPRRSHEGDDELARLYELRGRYRDAARARWDIFERLPHSGHYRALLAVAEPLDAVEYATDRAISCLEGLRQRDENADDLLAELYGTRGRHRDAARIRWNIFERVPHGHFDRNRERAYRSLLAAAEPLNAVEYAKNRAFAHLREQVARSGADAATSLVHLLFVAGDEEQAWRVAREHDLDDRQLAHIARALAHRHPAAAIPVLVRAAELHDRPSHGQGQVRAGR
ncbi:tetratricopeptide repeat protein [Lentzea chajnantorensis]